MKRFVNVKFCLVIALLAMAAFVTKPASTTAAGPIVCFPTCAENDGRMLSLSGGGLSTFIGGAIEVGFSSDSLDANALIGVFDPNSSGLWDNPTIELQFEIVADPNNDGTGTTVLETFDTTQAGFPAAENVWVDRTFANNALAKNAISGTYFYLLRITPFVPGGNPPADNALNGIKVRTNGSFSLTGETIQFIAKANTVEELAIIGGIDVNTGACPTATNYDGTWEFEFEVQPGTISLELWDGDLDFGNLDPADLVNKDTDDPNTPPTNVCVDTNGATLPNCTNPNIPLWAQGGSAKPEGVAQDTNPAGVGDPADDNILCAFTRSPGVTYRLLPPGAPINGGFVNSNPSGTSEWEKFLISTNAADNPDYNPATIPTGTWKLRIEGMDVFNQFALHFDKRLAPPCKVTIGDLVWEDKDGDGVKDASEPGIAGVAVNLLQSLTCNNVYVDLPGNAVTNSAGFYSFPDLPKACYQVQVSDPAGFVKTMNGAPGVNNNSQATPYDINLSGDECKDNLTADFGYKRQCECEVKLIETDFYCDEFKWKIKNEGDCDIVLTDINIEFPSTTNGKLDKVILGGQTVADVYLGSPAVIPPGLTTDVSKKTIKPGEYKWLVFDFTNYVSTDKSKYKVTIKFGDCTLQLIPPPVNCECKVKTIDVSWYCDELKWTVKNEGQCDVVLTNFNLTWPGSINGKLDFIKTSSSTLYTTPDIGSPYVANLVAANLGAESARKIAPGGTKTFYIDFYNNASTDKSKYTGALKFGDCEVKFPTPPPVNCDCSKITTVKYKVYGDQLLWTIKNEGNCDLQLTSLNFDWLHDYNGKLSWIKLGNDVVWDGNDVYSPWSYSPGTSGKKIAPGETKTLTFDFCNNAKNDPSKYTGYIMFGTCKKVFPTSWKY